MAGFWRRVFAFLIDYVLILFPFMLVVAMPDQPFAEPAFTLLYILMVLILWLYFSLMESSPWQATLGKRLLRIRVADDDGGPLTFGRTSLRFAGKLISGSIFGVGYLMAAFTPRKQALHDFIARTIVVRR